MVTFKREGYVPLAVREDVDGKLWIKAKARDAITAMNPAVICGESCGWGARNASAATATGVWVYVGFNPATQATADYSYYQIGGYASQCVFAASIAATGGIGVRLQSVSIATMAASASSSLTLELGVFGIYATTDSSSTTHDIFLMGNMVQNSS